MGACAGTFLDGGASACVLSSSEIPAVSGYRSCKGSRCRSPPLANRRISPAPRGRPALVAGGPVFAASAQRLALPQPAKRFGYTTIACFLPLGFGDPPRIFLAVGEGQRVEGEAGGGISGQR